MSCHFRIASKDARLGQPEAKLGLTPGGGDTQRLPRATGPERAVQLIVSGEPIGAGEALGLIDENRPGRSGVAGLTLARKITAENRVLRRLRDDDSKWTAARANRSRFNAAATNERNRGLEARTRKPIAAA
jgi:3-hydroxyacyl-CoA dehydrogenase